MSSNQDTLDDDTDRPLTETEFDGATLQIGNDSVPGVAFAPQSAAVDPEPNQNAESDVREACLSRNRPGSVHGGASVRSTNSRTSMRPGPEQTDISARSFYCYKGTHFERAVEDCQNLVKTELDGNLKSSWLLTEIDHWDFEREKVILLCENSIIVIKYNFINEQLLEFKRILLHIINNINIGDFHYPNSSLMPGRRHGGIQIKWSQTQELTFGQRWNPWCSDIPWITLAHHPLIYNRKEGDTITYNVDEFFESLVATASKVFSRKRPSDTLKVIEGPITIESYASPVSLVFNQSSIGFFRDRNGVSF